MTFEARVGDVRAALLDATRAELTEGGHAAVSLRAVARRAGVSHAAPKHHFNDRAGLLSAVATDGFAELRIALEAAASAMTSRAPTDRVVALGRAYVRFGLANPALFELMFRPAELRDDDPDLIAARAKAITVLADAVDEVGPCRRAPSQLPLAAVSAWAIAHGLVVLIRDGALGRATDTDTAATAALAEEILLQFARDAS